MRYILLALAIFLFVLLMASIPKSQARDDGRYAGSPNKAWFDDLTDKMRMPCCSDADGTAVTDADWDSKDGHYRVKLHGEWWDVPDDAVITEPNRDGRTIVWPIPYWDGDKQTFKIRCFIVGSGA
jgi:hypothetical protein